MRFVIESTDKRFRTGQHHIASVEGRPGQPKMMNVEARRLLGDLLMKPQRRGFMEARKQYQRVRCRAARKAFRAWRLTRPSRHSETDLIVASQALEIDALHLETLNSYAVYLQDIAGDYLGKRSCIHICLVFGGA